MSTVKAPPFPPVENIPPVIETAPGEPLPHSTPVTIAMTEKYGPKGANHLTPEELWALAPAEREAYLAAQEAAVASSAPSEVVNTPAPAEVAPAAKSRAVPQPGPAPEAPPFPPVENIPPVIETAPGEPLPHSTPVTIAMTEKYGPKGANHLTPEELWALAKERKEKEAREAQNEAEKGGDVPAEGAAAVPVTAPAESAPAAKSRAVPQPGPTPEAPPFPRVENIPPVIETAPGELLPSEREMTVAMTEKYGPKGANHRTPEELWALAKESAEKAAAESAQTVASNVAAAAAAPVKSAAPARTPFVPEAPRPRSIPAVIDTAPGNLLPSEREMTVAMTEKYGPKQPTRLTPAELELRAGYRSKLPPAKASPLAGRGVAAGEDGFSSPNKGTAAAASTPGSTTKAPVAGGQAAPGMAGKTATQAAPPGAAPAAAGKAAAQAAPSGAAPGATGKGQAAASGSGKGSGSAASGGSSRGTAAQGSNKGAAAGGEAGASPSVGSKITALGSSLMQNKLFMSAFAVGAAALTVFSIYKGVELYNRYCLNQAITEMQQKELQTVHLYIHHRSPLSPSISIPCTRIETYLRVAKIPYEAHCISDPSVSPNGHLPFIVYDNQRVAGPQQIVDFLASTFNVFLDNQLTDDQYATGVAVMKALEYSLVRGYMRSIHVERPDLIRPYYSEMHHTPDFITRIALSRLRAHIEETNDTSGYNRLTSEQFQFELAKDAKAIETLLSRHAYLFSDAYPSSFDCALYAWLLPIVAMEDAADVNAVFEYIVASESLTNFVRRMTELAFPDLDELVLSALEGDQPPPSEPARPYSSQPASRQESRLSRVSLTERRNSLSNQSHRERRNSMSQRRQDLSRGDGRSLSNSVTPRREATQN